MAINIIDELLEEATALMGDWDERRAQIPWWHPRNESGSSSGGGSGSGTGGGSGDGGGAGGAGGSGGSGSGTDDDDDDDDEDTGGGKEPDWKKLSRKHEREAKKERRERERLEREATERNNADQTEHEKAVKEAREAGEKTAREAAEKERRGDRLENAVIKLAGKGIKRKVKGEDDKEVEKVFKFADPDDAVTNIERMIRNGDLDEDDLFNDKGKVKEDVLKEALDDLLDNKPHLVASASNGDGAGSGTGSGRKVHGSADGGKGSGSTKELEDLTTEEHFERIRQHKS